MIVCGAVCGADLGGSSSNSVEKPSTDERRVSVEGTSAQSESVLIRRKTML